MTVQPHEVPILTKAVEQEIAAAPIRPHELAKRRVEARVSAIVGLIQRDKLGVLKAIQDEQNKLIEECRSGARPKHSFLPMVGEIFAKRLHDSWTEEEREGIQVFEGYCFVGRHQWFVISGDPDEVQEPYWDYVVDPLPSGLLVFGVGSRVPADVVVAPPLSLWAKNYLGAPEEMMRLSEATAAAECTSLR
jgi:hypothetical protein